MQTQEIRKMIKEAVAMERKTGNLADALHGFATMRGVQLSSDQHNNICKLIYEYVQHAPVLLDEIASAAEQAGIIDQVIPILETAEQYFFAPVDIIPDHLGILGLMDDAYLIHSLIQALSDSYRDQTGQTLLSLELTKANQFIRGLIGEPHASMLDVSVASVLNSPIIQQFISLFGSGFEFNITEPDPIWGNATIDEIVDARLGALGIV